MMFSPLNARRRNRNADKDFDAGASYIAVAVVMAVNGKQDNRGPVEMFQKNCIARGKRFQECFEKMMQLSEATALQ
jgi:hypothetical protein